jgi:hypothetical protein
MQKPYADICDEVRSENSFRITQKYYSKFYSHYTKILLPYLGWMAHVCKPRPLELEAEGSQVQASLGYIVGYFLKNINKNSTLYDQEGFIPGMLG